MYFSFKQKTKTVFLLFLSAFIAISLITTTNNATAAKVPWDKGAISNISAGGDHACAIANGNVYCWGDNRDGRVGNGQDSGGNIGASVSYPVAVDKSGVLNGKTMVSVSAGKHSTCAIDTENSLYCWGRNDHGQLGDGTTTNRLTPVKVGGLLEGKQVTQVSVNNYEYDRADMNFTCAVADGKAYCWGRNTLGQLGDGTTVSKSTPVEVNTSGILSGKTVKQVVSNRTNTCAITNDSVAACWGNNSNGQFGNNSTTSSNTPVSVFMSGTLSGKNISQIAIREDGSCVLASGDVYCWGYNNVGQLGDGTIAEYSRTPVAVDKSAALANKTVINIVSGAQHTCAVTSDYGVYCWGYNDHGQLSGDIESSNVPRTVDTSGVLAGKQIVRATAGASFSCAASTNESYCWGDNDYYNLGSGYLGPEVNARYISISRSPVTVSKNVPAITSVSPESLEIGKGDQQVKIVGSGISSFSKVIIDGVEYRSDADYEYIGEEITVTVPSENITQEKTVDVTIENPDGESTTSLQALTFKNLIPAITSIYPNEIALKKDAKETFYINSTSGGFLPGATVKIGGIPATVTYTSSSSVYVEFTMPSNLQESGVWNVEVTNPSGASSVLNNAVEYNIITPNVTSIEPSTGYVNTNNTVSIKGTGLARSASAPPKVFIDGLQASFWSYSVDPDDTTALIFTYGTAYQSTPGKVNVVVENDDGFRQTIIDGYEFISEESSQPAISFISPSQIKTSISNQAVVIYGEKFSNESSVKIGGRDAVVLYADSGIIHVYAPESETIGAADVTVTNPDGATYTYVNGISYYKPAPKVISSATFSNDDGIKKLSIEGVNLVGADNPSEYAEALQRSLVTLNGNQMKFCAEGMASTYETAGYSTEYFSDDPPCYELFNSIDGVLITPERATIRLPDNFDTAAQGTVSINGSNTFTFNQQTGPGEGEDPAEPTVIVNNKSLDGRPTAITKRPTFSGTAEPGARVTVTVHSDPIICSAIADSNGNWSCTLPSDLPSGNHTVTVDVTNPDGSTEQLGPYAVLVSGGQAAATIKNTTPLAPSTGFERKTAAVVSGLFLAISAVFSIGVLGVFSIRLLRSKRA